MASQSLYKDYWAHLGNYDNNKVGNLMEIVSLKMMEADLHYPRIQYFKNDGVVMLDCVTDTVHHPLSLTVELTTFHTYNLL